MVAISVVALASALLLYITAGYPFLLRYLARRRPRPVRRGPLQPALSVIIPVYNGERFLEDKLRSVLALEYPKDRMEIVVVSDGSTDGTDEIAQRFAAQGVRLLRLPRGGKPAALNAAFEKTHGEILVLTDVRQILEPASVALLMENFSDPHVGAVSGELVIREGATDKEADIGLYWRFESWIRRNLSAIDSLFGATGPFYAIRRELVVPLPADILLDDMYLPLAAFFRGYRLVVDERARAYDYPTSLETEFRRKVRTLGGNYQILWAYPGLAGPQNRIWLHYMSYKFGRLLLPWLLIAIAAASFGLPHFWSGIFVAAQVLFYGMAVIDGWIPKDSRCKKLSSPARTFVVMMAATVAGLSVFFVPARSLWRVTSAGKLS